jgi:hypothetical protein
MKFDKNIVWIGLKLNCRHREFNECKYYMTVKRCNKKCPLMTVMEKEQIKEDEKEKNAKPTITD